VGLFSYIPRFLVMHFKYECNAFLCNAFGFFGFHGFCSQILGLACQGKDIVFRFIIDYSSSLREFYRPLGNNRYPCSCMVILV
jgi:hypothetical protein